MTISIHEVFADLDKPSLVSSMRLSYFNLRGLRRPRHDGLQWLDTLKNISIHEVFADLDWTFSMLKSRSPNFNPRGLRRPRQYEYIHRKVSNMDFNPRGLRRPRQSHIHQYKKHHQFQSTRSSQTSTRFPSDNVGRYIISIHEVFADLDPVLGVTSPYTQYFNPRGLRRPRRGIT